MRVENAVGIIGVALLALGPGMDLRGDSADGRAGRTSRTAWWSHDRFGLFLHAVRTRHSPRI